MIGIQRRGACPSLSVPMATGDGLLLRLNIAGVDLSPASLAAISNAARRFGNGMMEVTSRGNLQVRGFSSDTAARFAELVGGFVLEPGGFQVTRNALAGVDRAEIRDPGPLIVALRQCGLALEGRLAPKVSAVVDAGGSLPLHDVKADIRIVALARDRVPVWLLSVGGDSGTARPLGIATTDSAAIAATREILDRIAGKGPGARATELETGEIEGIPGLEVYTPGSGRAGRQPVPIGTFELKDGRLAIGLGAAYGAVRADAMEVIMSAAGEAGIPVARLAPGRGIMLLGVTEPGARTLRDRAACLGLATDPSDPRLAIAACAGAPACGSAHLDTRQLAARIAESAAPLLDGSFRMHLSGCAKRCADPGGSRLSLIAGPSDGRIRWEGGKPACSSVAVDPDRLPVILHELADAFARSGNDGETAQEFCHRHGAFAAQYHAEGRA